MDRNSIIGLVLIGLILIGYSIFTKPARDRQAEERRRLDSIARIEQLKPETTTLQQEAFVPELRDTIVEQESQLDQRVRELGDFAGSSVGEEEKIVMENDLMEISFSTQGGRPYRVNLKNYQTHDSLPLILFDGDSTIFSLQFFADNRRINTGELFFEPIEESYTDSRGNVQQLTMRLNITETAHIDYIYRLIEGQYMIDFDIRFIGMNTYRTDQIQFNWEFYAPSTERGFQNESNYTTLYYRYHDGDVESFSSRTKKEIQEETVTTRLKWIAFSHQFFSSIIIAGDYFEGAYMVQERFADPGKYIRRFSASVDLPFNNSPEETLSMNLYLGPNHHKTLKSYEDLKLENVVTVGGSMIRWLNEWVIIPIFNWLSNWIANFGIIILLLTIILKVALFPLTYRSYKSQAVMRVLKPQVDEINEKYPKKEDAMKKQQAVMDLYKRAGANPMGGCLPMLLQLPILYAMFRFFPTSIELRQESFLWAKDLSTYDSILDLPFTIPMYGDHVSLFTLLMTVTTILSMRISNQVSAGTNQMPGMKTMMYIMPVMFMLILNNFSAALTYYYFLANLITLGQNAIFKRFTDEEKILEKINAKKDKPKKKSGFQRRLEELQKQQQQQARKQAVQRRKR
ncbi:MAG: membrane protein insertase YidC [Bacteroidales bacterium]|nr:membrane protein insertase YidC [Bacteroidales bacterium]MBN2697884.1 membrane protein insertase YidC [Bacteroidales bacterium]